MRLNIRHATTYAYDPPAERCALRLRLYPPDFAAQTVLNWSLSVNGQVLSPLLTTATGDMETIWTWSGPASEINILAEGEVETVDAAGVVRGLRDQVRPGVYLRPTALTEADEAILSLARSVSGKTLLDRMHALLNSVADAVAYTPASTTAGTTAAEALKAGRGVCQDHAHVFISAARWLCVPARYVVGYLLAEGAPLAQTHAWAEVFVPEIGWVGFDPSSRLCPTERYVRLGCGLDAADAAPIRGNVAGIHEERLSAHVDISPARDQGMKDDGAAESQTQQ